MVNLHIGTWLAGNKRFIAAVIVFSFFGVGAAFALPYTPSDAQLNPACAPGSADCYVSIYPAQTGNNGKFLTTDGTDVSWESLGIGMALASATEGSVFFAGTSGVLEQDNANLFWDNTNNRLGIGLSIPSARLHLAGGTTSTGAFKIASGSYLSSPQAGAFEHVSGKLSFTGSDGFRSRLNPRLASTLATASVATWSARAHSATAGYTAITWSPELGIFVATSNGADIMTSPDGITWTTRTAPEANNWGDVAWSPELGLFVSVANTGTNRIMTSPDGINWTLRTPPETQGWNAIAWSSELGIFVVVAGGTDHFMTSPDGINWTVRTASSSQTWVSVVWSPELNLFVALANSNATVTTSPDGINWTSRSIGASQSWRDIVWSPELGLFVAVASNGGSVVTSPDGITWTTRSAVIGSWRSISWSPELGLFAAVAVSNGVMTSPDGINWTARSVPEANNWLSITWSPELGIFAAVASSGNNRVMTSKPTDTRKQYVSIFNRGTNPQNILGALGISHDSASAYVLSVAHDGNNTNRFGLLIQAGLDDHTAAGPSTLISFADGDGTTVGSITFGSSATAYNTTSDQRLKDIVNDTTTLSLNTLNQIKIHDFSWKADPEKKVYAGVFAQELYDVFPMAVTKPQDESTGTWMVDYSKLTPLIISSIQEIDMNFKSLDATKENTLAYLIKRYVEDVGTVFERVFVRSIDSENIETDRLCFKNGICVTGEEMERLLNGSGVSPSLTVPAPEPAASEEIATPEESETLPTPTESLPVAADSAVEE